MSSTAAFRGFIPARKKGGNYNNEAVTDTIEITSTGMTGSPTNKIFTGDPVVLPGANFATISPFIAATLKPSGVFMGCQYVENGEQKFSRFWPGTVSATDIKFFVITDPDQTYYIQASLTVSAAELLVVRAIGRAKFPDEGSDDAKPILEVWLNHHRDRFVTATASTA